MRGGVQLLVAIAVLFVALEARAVEALHDWRARDGDDPAWAAPAFDDGDWDALQLHDARVELRKPGTRWLRTRITRPTGERRGIAVAVWHMGDAFELYLNGQRFLADGAMPPRPRRRTARPRVITIPDEMLADGTVVIAVRMWTGPPWPEPPFLEAPVIGRADAVRDHADARFRQQLLSRWPGVFGMLTLLTIGFYHLLLWFKRREFVAYLWLFTWAAIIITAAALLEGSRFGLTARATWRISLPLVVLSFTPFFLFVRAFFDTRIRLVHVLIPASAVFAVVTAIAAHWVADVTWWLQASWAAFLALTVVVAPLLAVETWKRRTPDVGPTMVGVVVFAGSGVSGLLLQMDLISVDTNMLVVLAAYVALPLGMALSLANRVSRTMRELQATQRATARFVPKDFLELLNKDDIIDVECGDSAQLDLTVLFSDIRGFTTLSEQLGPAATFAFINDYLSHMVPCIKRHGGFVGGYLGDGIMALFPGTSDAALDAALDMLKALADFNRERDDAPIAIGLGVNSGSLMLGTVGGEESLAATVIGDTVNLASRIEGMTKEHNRSLLLSDATRSCLENADRFDLVEVGCVTAKGRAEPITIFACIGVA